MWSWYAGSALCIVYLKDVSSHLSVEERQAAIMESEWFTRGWTLQELLAPKHMTFYDQGWKPIGTRDELADQISRRTGIKPLYFGDLDKIKEASAATRLSWAAGRTLTRPEDVAHCLFGIMGVQVPPQYGNGKERAFRELQMKFTKEFPDQSIFAWEIPSEPSNKYHGLFAPSPDAFATTGRFKSSQRSVWRWGWEVTDQWRLSGDYFTSHPVPWVGTIKAQLNDIAISIDAVDESGRVPRLRLQKRNGVYYRVNINKMSLNGRKDYIGRSMWWRLYIIHILPLSWKKHLNIAL